MSKVRCYLLFLVSDFLSFGESTGIETNEIVFAKMLQQYNKMTSIDRPPDLSNFKTLAPRMLTLLKLYLDLKVVVGQHLTEEGMCLAVTAINTCLQDVNVNTTACKVV